MIKKDKKADFVQRTWKLTIIYNGLNYCGWQRQNGTSKKSVQAILEDSLREIFNDETISLQGSGRTDAGVHAIGQVASFEIFCHKSWTDERLKFLINSRLPNDIFIRNVELWKNHFHARFSAISKTYFYIFSTKDLRNPFAEHLYHHCTYELNLAKIHEAKKKLIGTYDFGGFCAKKKIRENYRNFSESEKKAKYWSLEKPQGNIRTIYDIEMHEKNGLVVLVFHGNGFLYKMVRSLVGHLLWIGSNRCTIKDTQEILNGKIRTTKVETAPANGLFLAKVYYENENWQNYHIFDDKFFPHSIFQDYPVN